ncbi:alkaline phosphatase family protein [Halobaculum sp. MBLA0147]|uniref:alkaline phosphatase family protein n=1 Tax=Halobaculum sp. MBLA0147 TaxID=3079934 RepID=UPI003524F7EC
MTDEIEDGEEGTPSSAADTTATRPGERRDGYVTPAWGGRCFARVPGTVGDALGVDVGRSLPPETLPDGSFDRVVLLLIDGLGRDRFHDARESVSLFDRLARAGETTGLTSVYPSETAAAITTVHTGRTPSEHGLLGWNLHLPSVGRTCQTLPFVTRPADDARRDAAAAGADPWTVSPAALDREARDLGEATDGAVEGRTLFDGDTVYQRLAERGVICHTVQPSRIVGGGYGSLATRGAESHGVDSVAGFAVETRRRVASLADADERGYVYAYWPNVDGAAHAEGTTAAPYRAELAAVAGAVERELDVLAADLAGPGGAADDTLLLLTADHGHLDSDPTASVDLSSYPEVWDNLATHDDGRPVLPTGGPRNLHLHLADGTRETVRAALDDAPFAARIYDGETAVDEGLFGPGEVSPKLRERVGDLVVVPREVGVWFGDEGRKLAFVGQHGGQHPDEMDVPFLACSLSEFAATA